MFSVFTSSTNSLVVNCVFVTRFAFLTYANETLLNDEHYCFLPGLVFGNGELQLENSYLPVGLLLNGGSAALWGEEQFFARHEQNAIAQHVRRAKEDAGWLLPGYVPGRRVPRQVLSNEHLLGDVPDNAPMLRRGNAEPGVNHHGRIGAGSEFHLTRLHSAGDRRSMHRRFSVGAAGHGRRFYRCFVAEADQPRSTRCP